MCTDVAYNTYTAPFKFDFPSPDDMVSSGLRSSKIGSKGILLFSILIGHFVSGAKNFISLISKKIKSC